MLPRDGLLERALLAVLLAIPLAALAMLMMFPLECNFQLYLALLRHPWGAT